MTRYQNGKTLSLVTEIPPTTEKKEATLAISTEPDEIAVEVNQGVKSRSLMTATSYDSEVDIIFENEGSTPLNRAGRSGRGVRRGGSTSDLYRRRRRSHDSTGSLDDDAALSQRATYDSDFEILPDDEEAEDDAGNFDADFSEYESPPVSPTRRARAEAVPNEKRFFRHARADRFFRSNQQQQQQQQQQQDGENGCQKDEKPRRRVRQTSDMKSPLNSLKAIRDRAIAAYKEAKSDQTTAASASTTIEMPDWMKESAAAISVGSSSDSSSYDGSQSDDDESFITDDEVDHITDFSVLSKLPNSFLNLPPDVYDYLDPHLVKNIGEQDVSTFAWEHHLLVKGLMQLLAERDHIGVEGDVDDPSNVTRKGPLKKRYAQLWFVKYVEIRQGNLTFYGDNLRDGSEERTTVHLRKRTCTCQADTTKDGSSAGFVFELIVEGGHKTLWMAKSEEEREAWIRAINQAMIGETDDSLNYPLDLTLYQTAILAYQRVQSSLKEVKTLSDYRVAVDSLLYRQTSSSALRIPMKWVRDQLFLQEEKVKKEPDAPHQRVRSNISSFWKSLCNTSVVLNGYMIRANTPYSAERVIGSLSRCILEFDKVEGDQDVPNSIKRADREDYMTEVEAVAYCRSILIGILRTNSRGDVHTAIENLVMNENVSCVKLESSEPLHIDVSFAGDDFSEYEPPGNDVTGWVATKGKKQRVWKDRFFVVSEGVLSFFERAKPRPYGLRGQVVLSDAKLKALEEEILVLQTKNTERQLKFENRADFLKWKGIIERYAGADATPTGAELPPTTVVTEVPPRVARRTRQRRRVRGNLVGKVKNSEAGKRAMKAMKEAREAGMKSIKNARGILVRGIRGGKDDATPSANRRRPTPEMLLTSTRTLQDQGIEAEEAEKRDPPTVQVVVELNSTFKVVSNEQENDEEALLVVRMKLFQGFLLSGGSNGRLARGDELIEMEFIEGDGLEEIDHEFLEPPTVL